MPWWAWFGIYVVGALITFRVFYISSLGQSEEEKDKCEQCLLEQCRHGESDLGNSLVAGFLWPILALIFGVCLFGYYGVFIPLRFILFPRGIRTKYSLEKERRLAQEAEIKELEKLAREYDLPLPSLPPFGQRVGTQQFSVRE